ncbi:M28 family metallopeptidase [Salinilacihabitans rarus]|uniref:M28 family metallopeptidase n=1 Tax=Salinilacihabitans rarus TaxID=2961596 RepID=UPI0020C8E3E1|nr:M28 family metallopeptidase [Salinilacihabitans rarus]
MTDADDRDPALERAIGRAWADDAPWELLTELTALDHRMGGSPGERRAAELVRDAFADAGLREVDVDEFPMRYWERGTSEFAVVGPDERSFEAIALPYSPAGDVEGPLVDVGYGTPEEIEAAGETLRGGIAVASTTTPPGRRFVHRMEKFGHAVAAGAEAFVFANHVPGQLPPTGALAFDGEAAMPGVGVSAETGDWLSEYARDGGRARLRVDATTEAGTSRNVVGTVGPDTDEEIVVVAHYDAHDVAEGALDNGCGIATVLGAARLLARIEDDLARRVRIAAVGCEEVGLLGAEALADDLDLGAVHAVVNVDGAGRFRGLKAYSHAAPELASLADRVTDRYGQPVVHERDPHPFSDHWPFLRAGVPALQLHSDPADGGERGRGWGHTAADTRDKVDPRNLREHAVLTALLVRDLTRTDVPRIDDDDLRDALREQAYEPGMRASGIWPPKWK